MVITNFIPIHKLELDGDYRDTPNFSREYDISSEERAELLLLVLENIFRMLPAKMAETTKVFINSWADGRKTLVTIVTPGGYLDNELIDLLFFTADAFKRATDAAPYETA